MIVGGGRVLTPDGVVDDGAVTTDDDLITRIGPATGPLDIDARGGWIVPGFIDLQINGAHGIDVTTEPDRIDELGAALVRYGVTAFVPTVITCTEPVRRAALAAWAERDATAAPGAVPLGLHIEGPMLSPARKGAHPADLLVAPSSELIDGWSRDAGVVLATVAPELPGATDVIAELTARGRGRVDRPHRRHRRRLRGRAFGRRAVRHAPVQRDAAVLPPRPRPGRRRARRRRGRRRADLRRHPRRPDRRADGVARPRPGATEPGHRRHLGARRRRRPARERRRDDRRRRRAQRRRRARRQHAVARPSGAQPRRLHRVRRGRRRRHGDVDARRPARPRRSRPAGGGEAGRRDRARQRACT